MTGSSSMFVILRKRRLRWLGHVFRMDDSRIPKDLQYSQLATGLRKRGRPLLRFKDVCKRDLTLLDINTNRWENLAQDRTIWRNTIHQSLQALETKRLSATASKRLQPQPDIPVTFT